MDSFPTAITPAQFCESFAVSRKTLERLIREGVVVAVKLGRGRSAPLRIVTGETLERFGLVSKRSNRRDQRQAERESHAAAARFGETE